MSADLTPREIEVLRLLADGMTNKEIARRLSIARSTADSHVHHILHSIRARNRVQAAHWAYRHGYTSPADETPA